MTPPLLQLDAIAKSFGAVRALRAVSFDLLAGEVHCLLGENGAGKSTLIKVVTGAHKPDSGSIRLEGMDVGSLDPASARALGIACVYQQPALFPDLSVAENIELAIDRPSPFRRIRHGLRRERALGLLRRVGADIAPETEAGRLSMPEQQLVEIAKALGGGARILILDEPTACLPAKDVERLFGTIRQLRAAGVGIVYITHRLDEISAIGDRVTVLRDGESVGTRRVNPTATGAGPQEAGLTEGELIQWMVGREISHIYPPPGKAPGRVLLSLRGVGNRESGVAGVDLDLRAGEVLGLAGLVGAGRTELARILFGMTPADSGEIHLDGRRLVIETPGQAIEAGIAYVPEDRRRHGLILDMSVAQNVSMASLNRVSASGWLRAAWERELAFRWVQELGIKAAGPDAPCASLSGGNQQKVALARWLATEPKVLILDEPTQGVDVGAKSEIHRTIRDWASRGMGILLISSDLPEVIGMSDRVGIMRAGRLITVLGREVATAESVMAAALAVSPG